MTTQAAQVSTEVDASQESMWKALTNADVLGRAFFGSKVVTTWKVGGRISFRGEWKGKSFEDKGEILAFSAPKQLRFTHWSPLSGTEDRPENYHVVAFDIIPSGAKTKLQVTQDSQNDNPIDDATKKEFEKNWSLVLGELKKGAEKIYGKRSD